MAETMESVSGLRCLITKAREAGLTDEEIDALLDKAISKKAAKTEE